ncbi:MFS transporter [Desulforamulus aeronauticus]|uniref:Predicted arabinose efflux permease, MFS family n=1 Tax=Desulforamulus aeronauticus DSM 10349 TaxID=1121421 RepID=A0A1M6NCE4_9FIRM|nr:MFS transporter [Desulforamulus aeronauticus]SHJ93390.1 Predicted arabinose efflux permease, MFS family [Desulforamulus aeronauticus DSM 10349]
MTPTGSIFRNRFIQAIMLSAILLQIGIWVRNFAILLFVMEKTNNNPYAVSLISVVEFAPIFLFSIIGGTFADRWRPKKTMVWCDLLSALSVFVVLITIIFGSWEAIFFVTFISAILSQFSQPSAMKLFKIHVPLEQLQTGMAMFQTLMAVFMIIGPMLGTFIYQRFGIQTSILVMGIAFLLSAAVLTLLPPDKIVDKNKMTDFWGELKEGCRYVFNRREFILLGSVFVMTGLAVGIIQPLGIFIVMERIGLPKENLQWLLAANGAAMLIGGGLVMSLAKKIPPQKLLAMGLFINAVTVVGVGLSTNWTLTLAFEFLNGLFMPCIHIGINTLILKLTQEEFIGRVNGVLNPMFMGAMVITMSLAGWLKVQFSLVSMFGVSGLLFLLGMLLTVPLFKRTGELLAKTQKQECL